MFNSYINHKKFRFWNVWLISIFNIYLSCIEIFNELGNNSYNHYILQISWYWCRFSNLCPNRFTQLKNSDWFWQTVKFNVNSSFTHLLMQYCNLDYLHYQADNRIQIIQKIITSSPNRGRRFNTKPCHNKIIVYSQHRIVIVNLDGYSFNFWFA